MKSLKHSLHSAVRFTCDLYASKPIEANPMLKQELRAVLFPLVLDGITENLADVVSVAVMPSLPKVEDYDAMVYKRFLHCPFGVLIGAGRYQNAHFSEEIQAEIVGFLEKMLEEEVT